MTQQRTSTPVLERESSGNAQLNWALELKRPIQLIHRETGAPCKAIFFGDAQGMSPAYVVVDENGRHSVVPVSSTEQVEPEYISDSAEHLKSKFSSASATLSGKGSSSY